MVEPLADARKGAKKEPVTLDNVGESIESVVDGAGDSEAWYSGVLKQSNEHERFADSEYEPHAESNDTTPVIFPDDDIS